MRAREKQGSLSVQAIAGTRVVLFGMDIEEAALDGLLGFSIERAEGDGEFKALPNFLLFEANDGEEPDYSSRLNPFQEFLRGDYVVDPGRDYRYRVTAMYGSPDNLSDGDSVEVAVTTELERTDQDAVYFNRAVAASQSYAKRFGNQRPDDVPDHKALDWLSRGLYEGLLAFIAQADGPRWGLRAAVYEFNYEPALEAFAEAHRRGADVRIVFDCVKPEGAPGTKNLEAIVATEIVSLTTRRTNTKIAHNKFIVLLDGTNPVAVWTGSTNLTEGGIFGHSNLGHAVYDPEVAGRYLDYWTELHRDPEPAELKPWTAEQTPLPEGAPDQGTLEVFSPRPDVSALEWYAKRMEEAKGSVFLTAAFGVSKELFRIFEEDTPYLRYLLVDKRDGTVDTIRRDPDNLVSAGAFIGEGGWHQWQQEKLSGLNRAVNYIHTKYMLIDPLSEDPLLISGSANFSDPSTTDNDENMLIIRGNTRLADIYVGEFMRLFQHFRFRGKTKTPPEQPTPGPETPSEPATDKLYLKENDAWARPFYVAESPEQKERLLFSHAGT
jgi:phosphatidylserine/phosphatidylglycerophosphate/cardiolipin synthase-like enzyme